MENVPQTTTLTDVRMHNNSARNPDGSIGFAGGALGAVNSAGVDFVGAFECTHRSAQYGGCIWVDNTDVSLPDGALLTYNYAAEMGDALHIWGVSQVVVGRYVSVAMAERAGRHRIKSLWRTERRATQ